MEPTENEKIDNIKKYIPESLYANKSGNSKAAIEKFWSFGEIKAKYQGISLHRPSEKDKSAFFVFETDNLSLKSISKEIPERSWKEYTDSSSLYFSITMNGEYAGYCGVIDTSKELWEISITLGEKFRNQGIGFNAICIMLDEISNRLGVSEFRVRIMADNTASQRLFEKLGARPNGISEYFTLGEHTDEFIKSNAHLITDDIIRVAEKFGVEPEILLTHALEYKLG